MSYIKGPAREQRFLFPESIEDYITEENPVRFIDAFVDSPDLAAAGFGWSEPVPTGKPVAGSEQFPLQPASKLVPVAEGD